MTAISMLDRAFMKVEIECCSCSNSPKKTPRWGVRVAVQSWVLRSQEEGENSSRARTERVSYYDQPIVHGSFVLGERQSQLH